MGINHSKEIIAGIVLLVMLLSFVGNVYAITGSIGNARMILRVDQGDIIEKHILVKNVNDVSVKVELLADGDLVKDIDIKDNEFTLSPGQDKKAAFSINIKDAGTSESKIRVKFIPLNDGNSVGLSSTIIVIAEGNDKSFFDFFGDEDSDGEELDGDVSFGGSKQNDIMSQSQKKDSDSSKIAIVAIITLIMFFVLLALLVVSSKYQRKFISKSEKIEGVKSKPKKSADG